MSSIWKELAFVAEKTSKGKLTELYIHSNRFHALKHAIKVTGGENIAIRNNQIRMIDSEESDVAIFLGGEGCLIEENSIVVMPGESEKDEIIIKDKQKFPNPSHICTELFNLYIHNDFYVYMDFVWKFPQLSLYWDLTPKYKTSGGIQITGGSEEISITGNQIMGGAWNGITLGHLPDDMKDEKQKFKKTSVVKELEDRPQKSSSTNSRVFSAIFPSKTTIYKAWD